MNGSRISNLTFANVIDLLEEIRDKITRQERQQGYRSTPASQKQWYMEVKISRSN